MKKTGTKGFLTIKSIYAVLPAAACAICITGVVLSYLSGKLVMLSDEVAAPAAFSDIFHIYGYTTGVALVATLLSMIFGFFIAFLVWAFRRGVAVYVMQMTLAVPYAVVAFFALLLLSKHGILARVVYVLFGESVHASLPNLVHNTVGFSIVMSYVWKQTSFSCLLFFARLQRIGGDFADASRVLGASFRKSIVHILIPLLVPTAIPLFFVLFSYNYFAYEVAYIAGTSNPLMISVYIMQLFSNADVAIHQSSYIIMIYAFCIALCAIGACVLCYGAWRMGKRALRRRSLSQ